MREEYQQRLQEAKKQSKAISKKISRLKKLRKGEVDAKIHPLHEEAFSQIDCLECANCCKTTGPLFTQPDIGRLAKFLGLKAGDFIEKYLRLDEDNDYVLQVLPCPFLGPDNYCQVYEVRPKACREYPHTDRKNQLGILQLAKRNSQICPAVADIFQNLEL